MKTPHHQETQFDAVLLRWGGGCAVPVLLGVWGLYYLLRRVAIIPVGKGNVPYLVTLTGFDAVAVGCCLLAVALYGHFHIYWPTRPQLEPYTETAKQVALLLITLTFGYVAFAFIQFFLLS